VIQKKQSGIIRTVETFSEARGLLDNLADRKIGAICMKGVIVGRAREFWSQESELRKFAYEASRATKGGQIDGITLNLRHLPRDSVAQSQGNITFFKKDFPKHIDGLFDYEEAADDGSLNTFVRIPLLHPDIYPGVSHHLTLAGTTTFLMDRLSVAETRKLIAGQPKDANSYLHTNPIENTLKGETVDLKKGDYLALHTYGVMWRPVFAHATINSSEDRLSICFNPREAEEIYIDDLGEYTDFFTLEPITS
jgi:hypothetical protein